MSIDKPGRRQFLQRAGALIPAAGSLHGTVPIIARAAEARQVSPRPYSPVFFDASEWRFVQRACSLLIPNDALGPGALEAGVPEFIDRQMETAYGHGGLWYTPGPFVTGGLPEMGYQYRFTPREIYRNGIRDGDNACRSTQGAPFADVPVAVAVAFLKSLESGKATGGTLPARLFFDQLLKNTREGYFADPLYGGNQHMAGWKLLGFPGARADFADWIDHPNERYPVGPISINGDRN
jgi:gluconate 2-dehydrogenase gamma chain